MMAWLKQRRWLVALFIFVYLVLCLFVSWLLDLGLAVTMIICLLSLPVVQSWSDD
jgi:hypothetical protein